MGKKQSDQNQKEDGFMGQKEKPIDPKSAPKVRSKRGGVRYFGDWRSPKPAQKEE